MKQKITQSLPPKLFVYIKSFGWFGDFKEWSEVKRLSRGYDANNILQKVRDALLKVKKGEAIYERDSVLFDQIEYSWELLSALMWVAALNKGCLNVLDFGGSLGSTYFQNKRFLDDLKKVQWHIVEQPDFVKEGKRFFEDEQLMFHQTIEECLNDPDDPIQLFLFSSVLQYLEDPYHFLDSALNHKIEYILVDRTGFSNNGKMRLTLQKVAKKIYDASYPCWFFSEKDFLDFFEGKNYDLIADFNSLDQVNIPATYKGFLFKFRGDA